MTNSTDQYWDVNGTSLNTYAQNIVSIGGDRIAPPPVRGSNLVVPAQVGQLYMPKVADSKIESLGMWVIGANPDGTRPSAGGAQQFDDNWAALRNLLMGPGQFPLTKRFRRAGVLKTATAMAEYADGLNPQMNGRAGAAFTVDLLLADPYFYSDPVTLSLANGSNTVTIGGDAPTRWVKFHAVGPRVNVKIHNSTMGMDVTYESTLVTGDAVDIDVKAYTSKTTPSGGTAFPTNGRIRHSGDTSWFQLKPGANTVVVTSDTGTGAVSLIYQEAWI